MGLISEIHPRSFSFQPGLFNLKPVILASFLPGFFLLLEVLTVLSLSSQQIQVKYGICIVWLHVII